MSVVKSVVKHITHKAITTLRSSCAARKYAAHSSGGVGQQRPHLQKAHKTCERDHQAADPDEQIKGYEGDQSPSPVPMIQTDLQQLACRGHTHPICQSIGGGQEEEEKSNRRRVIRVAEKHVETSKGTANDNGKGNGKGPEKSVRLTSGPPSAENRPAGLGFQHSFQPSIQSRLNIEAPPKI